MYLVQAPLKNRTMVAVMKAKTDKHPKHHDKAVELMMWSLVLKTATCAYVKFNCAMDIEIAHMDTMNSTVPLVGLKDFLGDGVETNQ